MEKIIDYICDIWNQEEILKENEKLKLNYIIGFLKINLIKKKNNTE